MGALRGYTIAQMNTSNSFRISSIANKYANDTSNNTVTASISIIPAEAFTEDWHLAEGDHQIDLLMQLMQKYNLVYGLLALGSEPIREFYLKLLKYRKMLNLDEQQIKGQFLQGLSSDLEDDAKHIGTEQPLADLFEILEHIEMRRAEKKLGLEFVPIPKPDLPPKPVIKKVEIDSDEELANLTKKQLKLHIAKAVKKAVKLQHRYSICNIILTIVLKIRKRASLEINQQESQN
ncbi:23151_t:CDS:2 [Cetraspora pellucida]|uniref:23151_t:CDS:1 n=1 Tax=Cetraspora pellucida TaxID=1433469 RepID=A0A9N8WM92_9GLOM|nr:23151_t:CDS:2 [Cetraspora pellucida]